MERTIVGIDVGSSKVCTLVGETGDDGETRVIGVGQVPSRGIRKGPVRSFIPGSDGFLFAPKNCPNGDKNLL